jgi:hypothetical protein
MLTNHDQVDRLDRMNDRVHRASAVNVELFSEVVATACDGLPVLSRLGKTAAVKQLIALHAWTDAALALVELELPQWKIRRLVFEDGQWLCSLSKQVGMPLELDDTVDASHAVLPLAILSALMEVRCSGAAVTKAPPTVPLIQCARTEEFSADDGLAVVCDNFC